MLGPKSTEEIKILDLLLAQIHQELGIPSSLPAERGLPLYYQPPLKDLVVADIDFEGKPFVLTAPAAAAWKNLSEAAQHEGIVLQPFSGFRSYLYQKGLIKRHLDNGRPLDDILKHIAVPGYSEHHTGCAVDVTTVACEPLVEAFEETDAFRWLSVNAQRFHFYLSFPRSNKFGFIYEPWHWCFRNAQAA